MEIGYAVGRQKIIDNDPVCGGCFYAYLLILKELIGKQQMQVICFKLQLHINILIISNLHLV